MDMGGCVRWRGLEFSGSLGLYGVCVCHRGPTRPKASVLKSLDIMSDAMLKSMPRWDHLINSRTFNSSLVKRQLLESPLRRALPDRIRDLAMHKEGIEDYLHQAAAEAELPELAEVTASEAALSLANQTMAVIAAANILQDFAGTARGREMAEQMMARSAQLLPDALRKRSAEAAQA